MTAPPPCARWRPLSHALTPTAARPLAGSESIHLQVRGQGSLVVYVSRKPRGVLVDGVVRDRDFVYAAEQGILRIHLSAPAAPSADADRPTPPTVVQISL